MDETRRKRKRRRRSRRRRRRRRGRGRGRRINERSYKMNSNMQVGAHNGLLVQATMTTKMVLLSSHHKMQ